MLGSGSTPAAVARMLNPRSAESRFRYALAITLFAEPWRQTKTTTSEDGISVTPLHSTVLRSLFHKHPRGSQQLEPDKPDNRCRGQQGPNAGPPPNPAKETDQAGQRPLTIPDGKFCREKPRGQDRSKPRR